MRHEMEDVAVALDLHVLADGDRARRRDTRPRSLRPRSTSITCSARSFGSRWSCSARSASSRASAPRGRVPAIGWVVSLSPSTWRSSSGDAPTTSKSGVRTKNRYGLGLTRRSARYRPIPSSGAPVAGSVGRSNDWRRASTTWIASPAAMASLATSTAWMYSSRPRLVSIGPGRAPVAAAVARSPARRGRPSSAALGRGGPLEGLEDGRLGDPVAALEVGRLGVERGDRRQGVGQVVEDEDEVGLDERGRRDADRVAVGQRDGRLERARRRRRRARRPRRR